MEPQTLLIGVAGFVLSFLVIYLISVFSMREKTFEEVLEEQRKRQEEEDRKAKSERRAEKGERKKYRKFKEKPKEKSSPARETQPAAEAVVPAEVPVVVEESVTPTAAAAPTETGNKAKSPKSSKKAQKAVAGGDTGDVKPLVAAPRSSDSPAAARIEEEENVQVAAPAAPEQEQPAKKQKQKQQKQKQQEQQIESPVQAAAPLIEEEPKGNNTKTSKAPKQNEEAALLEKQIIVDEQKPAIASEENATKKLSKKEKKAAAAAATTVTTTTAAPPATPAPVVEPDVVVATEEKPVNQVPKEKRSKKGKTENGTSAGTQLISSVKGTTFNESEIQTLLDHLQSKQTKKPQDDSVAGLLEEKEKKILEGAKAQLAVTELKQKIITAEKQFDNKIKKLMNENQTLQSQAKKTESDYEENLATLTDRMKQLESNTVGKDVHQMIVDEVNKLKSAPVAPIIDPAEMASMKQKVSIMEKELNNNVLKLNTSDKNRKKLEEKVKDFEAKTQNENHQLEELNHALKNSNNEKVLLAEQNNQASEVLQATQTECASLKTLLQDVELYNKEAERNLLNLSKKVEELEEELVIVNEKNQVLLEENKLVPVTVEETLGERQEPAGAPNGDVEEESVACTKVALVEHERLLGEKQSEIVRLTTELGNKEMEAIARLDEKDGEVKALTTSLNVQVEEVERLMGEIQVFTNKNDDNCQSLDKSVLMRIFPDISVTQSLEHDIWVQTFEAEAVEYVKGLKQVSGSANGLETEDTLTEEECKIRLSEAEESYSETKLKLNLLKEELQKVTVAAAAAAQTSETEPVEELHKQIETLTSELQESTLQYTELQTESEETKTKLEDRLKELELTFSETKTLCMSLKEQLENSSISNSTEDAEQEAETLTVQLEEKNEVVTKLESQVQTYQTLLKVTAQTDLEQMRQTDANSTQSLDANSQTEKEDKYKLLVLRAEEDEKKVRDFSQTIVKLNGIIKTGQDALTQEQELVRKLKQQTTDKNSTGSPSPTREVQEASSSNDVGTSV